MKKLFQSLLLALLIASKPLSAVPQMQIKTFDDNIGLKELSQAIFEHPECQGDFAGRGFTDTRGRSHYYKDDPRGISSRHDRFIPAPERCGVSINAFKAVIEDFRLAFTTHMTTATWHNNPVNFKNNKKVDINTRLNDFPDTSRITRFVQHEKIKPETTICFMGDCHGSADSLVRNLWRLVAMDKLNPDLTIKDPNFIIVFLGDYVDRGRKGIEAVTTILTLKLRNWEKVFMVAGNHETGAMPMRDGFFEEIHRKYTKSSTDPAYARKRGQDEFPTEVIKAINQEPDIYDLAQKVFQDCFDNLPVALFLTCGNTTVQCCHGGIQEYFNPESFLQSKTSFYNVGSEIACAGLFWSDFCAIGDIGPSPRGLGCRAGKYGTMAYLRDNGLAGIFRAHQDMEGLLTFSNGAFKAPQEYIYTNDGPFHWVDVVKQDHPSITGCQLPISLFQYPVFTFSSAVEPRAFPRDSFGLVSAFDTWNKWMIEFCEYFLGKTDEVTRQTEVFPRHGKYVHINTSNCSGCCTQRTTPTFPESDPIGVIWRNAPDNVELEEGMNAIVRTTQSPISTPDTVPTSLQDEPTDGMEEIGKNMGRDLDLPPSIAVE